MTPDLTTDEMIALLTFDAPATANSEDGFRLHWHESTSAILARWRREALLEAGGSTP